LEYFYQKVILIGISIGIGGGKNGLHNKPRENERGRDRFEDSNKSPWGQKYAIGLTL
jgi:hypothetical protein